MPSRHAGPEPLRIDSPAMVETEIETRRPRLELRAAADKDALPLLRQALRALAQSAGADAEALHDAELALTEACANVVRHAYRGDGGTIEATIEARPYDLLVVVRDRGRGMPRKRPLPRRLGGLGLPVIEAVSREVEIRTVPGTGTEVAMALAVGRYGSSRDAFPVADSTVETVMRRLVAIAAAQADMAPGRISETLLAVEIVARHAPGRLIGDRVRVRLDRLPHGVELSIGPLERHGTAAVLDDANVPVLGSVVERLADAVWAVSATPEREDEGEELALRFAA